MIDVSELLTDPDFCTEFTLVKKTGEFVQGKFVTQEEEINIVGVTEPVSGRELEILPEADRLKNLRTFYAPSDVPLSVSSDGTISDSIIYGGKRFKLISGQNYSDFGYWQAMGVNEDGK